MQPDVYVSPLLYHHLTHKTNGCFQDFAPLFPRCLSKSFSLINCSVFIFTHHSTFIVTKLTRLQTCGTKCQCFSHVHVGDQSAFWRVCMQCRSVGHGDVPNCKYFWRCLGRFSFLFCLFPSMSKRVCLSVWPATAFRNLNTLFQYWACYQVSAPQRTKNEWNRNRTGTY